jgi:hypothetical protein
MRKLLKAALLFLVFPLAAEARSSERQSRAELKKELIQKLDASSRNMAEKGAAVFTDPMEMQRAYRALSMGMMMLQRETESDLNNAVFRFAGEMAFVDRSGKIGEILLPFWKKSPQRLLDHTEGLSDPKRKELKRQLKAALTASRQQ